MNEARFWRIVCFVCCILALIVPVEIKKVKRVEVVKQSSNNQTFRLTNKGTIDYVYICEDQLNRVKESLEIVIEDVEEEIKKLRWASKVHRMACAKPKPTEKED
jgi:hypothetical protein